MTGSGASRLANRLITAASHVRFHRPCRLWFGLWEPDLPPRSGRRNTVGCEIRQNRVDPQRTLVVRRPVETPPAGEAASQHWRSCLVTCRPPCQDLSLIHISEPTRLGM